MTDQDFDKIKYRCPRS
ncbi:hypothetical protein Trydic_g3627, partial [Trypoxylus dichotomus]